MADCIGFIVSVVMCHLVGDYVLQIDFIAKTKGENIYHLFVHCMLYCLPFMIVFHPENAIMAWSFLFITHFAIDIAKARYNKIAYFDDQVMHYIIAFVTLLMF